MPIAKPKHLDFPDEVTVEGKLVHIYSAHSNGKRSLESLIWLCGHYHHVEVVALSEASCNSARTIFQCRAAFMEIDLDPSFDFDS